MNTNQRKASIVTHTAQSHRQDWPDESLDPEWSGTAYFDLSTEEQALWEDWQDFHDDVVLALETAAVE